MGIKDEGTPGEQRVEKVEIEAWGTTRAGRGEVPETQPKWGMGARPGVQNTGVIGNEASARLTYRDPKRI